MTRPRPVRALLRLAVTSGALLTAALAAPTTTLGAAELRLPDLRMAPPRSFHVCGAPTGGTFQRENCPDPSDGDRWLRFDSVLMNVGEGTFRVVASRPSTDVPQMDAVQWIRGSDLSWVKRPTDAHLAYSVDEDGHPHWHSQGMERYQLFGLSVPSEDGPMVGVKHGYCFFDGFRARPELPRSPEEAVYPFASCGELGESQDLLRLRVGLSIGWEDEYPWDYAGQRIDISTVADGTYLLCLTADPANDFRELREDNNQRWARIRLTTTTTPSYGVDVTVLGRGRTPCRSEL